MHELNLRGTCDAASIPHDVRCLQLFGVTRHGPNNQSTSLKTGVARHGEHRPYINLENERTELRLNVNGGVVAAHGHANSGLRGFALRARRPGNPAELDVILRSQINLRCCPIYHELAKQAASRATVRGLIYPLLQAFMEAA